MRRIVASPGDFLLVGVFQRVFPPQIRVPGLPGTVRHRRSDVERLIAGGAASKSSPSAASRHAVGQTIPGAGIRRG